MDVLRAVGQDAPAPRASDQGAGGCIDEAPLRACGDPRGGGGGPDAHPPASLPSHLQILENMPAFTAKGLEGESSADGTPVVEVDDNVAKYLADSEEDEDAEATGASTSAGGPSS